ncbi:MAG: conjugal transfer protein TraX [Candidatus Methylumidiphilus alinenensis]|uniref:Conjugal transfer protein TraX n=1 Tax=Candidatus Methylumidiphilus alinenensis TaxID=2202197 RepID=A0A2W4RP42_9GAMM|nr:MAG: conjugal transfer protein TraX [Candidatus Methylumidiphilus alinenensis]
MLADGTAEALKWFALVLMVLDHANQYLCNGAVHWVFPIARLSFPLFGFVLAYNLARPGTLSNGAAIRTMKRLSIFALMASLPHSVLDGRLFPLNILATLLVATATVYLFAQSGFKKGYAILVFMLGGGVVEGNWFAVAVCVAAYRYCQSPTALRLLSVIASLVVLGLFINLNPWALAVLPVILLAPSVNLKINRHKNLFYWFYPAHLAVIALLKTEIR